MNEACSTSRMRGSYICPLFCIFVLSVAGRELASTVLGGMRVENAHVDEGALESSSHCPLAAMSRHAPSCVIAEELAPSCVIAEELEGVSPVMGCRCGSTWASWHTSVSKRAV